MTDPTDRDPARDAWLSEALRHAPDAQATPPLALSEEILRQARAVARGAAGAPVKKPPARNAWAAAWSWLARPPVAAGFASVMVATLVGLMWWDQPIDPTLARPPARDASPAAPAAPASAVSGAPESAAKLDSEAPAAPRLAERRPSAPAPSASFAPAAKPAARRAEHEALRQSARREPLPFEDSAATVDAAPAAAEPTPQAPARESGPVPLAAPAPAPAAPPSPPAAMRLREDAAPPSTTGTRATDARDEPRGLVAGALDRGAVAKALPQAASTSRENTAAARPPALGALLASVASEPERWGFQRGDAIRPMNPALQRWLARLDAATSTHWREGTETAQSHAGGVLRLYRDGTLTATLRLDDEGVWFAAVWRAALPAATTAELKRALDDATP